MNLELLNQIVEDIVSKTSKVDEIILQLEIDPQEANALKILNERMTTVSECIKKIVEELEELNQNIIGKIEVIAEFHKNEIDPK